MFSTQLENFHQIWNYHPQTLSVLKCLKFVPWQWLKPLPNYKNLSLSKLKVFLEDIIVVAQMVQFQPERVENIVGRASYLNFLLVPQCFQKAFPLGDQSYGWNRHTFLTKTLCKLEGCPRTTCPAGLTLTFDLPAWMIEMEHLHVMVNNYVKLFWNPSTTVEVIVWTNLDRRIH